MPATDFCTGVLLLFIMGVYVAMVLHGGWWNLVDAIGYFLHRMALRGRARSRRIEAEISDRWARLYETAE